MATTKLSKTGRDELAEYRKQLAALLAIDSHDEARRLAENTRPDHATEDLRIARKSLRRAH